MSPGLSISSDWQIETKIFLPDGRLLTLYTALFWDLWLLSDVASVIVNVKLFYKYEFKSV